MPIFLIIGGILALLHSRAKVVSARCAALCKKQQSAQQPVAMSASTTCKCCGPIQHRTPQTYPPTNVPIPTGMVSSDDGQNIVVASSDTTFILFLDGLRNVIGALDVDNGQDVRFNYGTYKRASAPQGGVAWACGSIDTFVAVVRLQGPGGSTDIRNPFYTTASAAQCWGKIGTSNPRNGRPLGLPTNGCNPSLQEGGVSLQDETSDYLVSAPVNKGSMLNQQPASAIISPGNASCTQHS